MVANTNQMHDDIYSKTTTQKGYPSKANKE